MGPTSLFKFMVAKGMDAPKDANALGSNLWSAWKAGRIMKAPNGVYTLLDDSGRTEHDHPINDYDEVGAQGFPTPSPAQYAETAAVSRMRHATATTGGEG